MKRKVLIIPLILLTLGPIVFLSGCLAKPNESETVWAKLGSSARVVSTKEVTITDNQPDMVNGEKILSKEPVDILIKNNKGEEKRSKVNPQGLILIDEPTLEYYIDLDKRFGVNSKK